MKGIFHFVYVVALFCLGVASQGAGQDLNKVTFSTAICPWYYLREIRHDWDNSLPKDMRQPSIEFTATCYNGNSGQLRTTRIDLDK